MPDPETRDEPATIGDNSPRAKSPVTALHGERVDPDKVMELLDPVQDERVTFIVELYGMSYTKRAIIMAFRKQYGLSLEQTYRYIRIAEWRIKEESEGTPKEKVQQAMNRVKTITRKALQAADHRAAIVAEQHLEKLQGILVEPKVQINLNEPLVQTIIEKVAIVLEENVAKNQPELYDKIVGQLAAMTADDPGTSNGTDPTLSPAAPLSSQPDRSGPTVNGQPGEQASAEPSAGQAAG